MSDVYLNGKRIRLLPSALIGAGAEAEVFDLGDDTVAKIFRAPAPEHEAKLKAFPVGLPARVASPTDLLFRKDGRLAGYRMPFFRGAQSFYVLAQPKERRAQDGNAILRRFRDLAASVETLHHCRVVIGDFNDLNVLARGTEAMLIDADSFQYGSWLCRMYTERFLDPALCDTRANRPKLVRSYDELADWYAYAALLFHALLSVDPFGGVYLPKDPKRRIPHDMRPLKGISVFHPEVRYPKPALPFALLPDSLLDRFAAYFVRRERGAFPATLLDDVRWTHCATCGIEHARAVCPRCQSHAPSAVRETVRVEGDVTCETLLRLPYGETLLDVAVTGDGLRWLARRGNTLVRETGPIGPASARHDARLHGDGALVAGDADAFLCRQNALHPIACEHVLGEPSVASDGERLVYASQGALWREDRLGPARIGNILEYRTRFWIHGSIGFGFYRVGDLLQVLWFDPASRGIDDRIKLPPVHGQALEAMCHLAGSLAWFVLVRSEHGKIVRHIWVIDRVTGLLAEARSDTTEGSWFDGMASAGAIGKALFVPTDDGLVRVEVHGGQLVVVKSFPATASFLDSHTRVLPAADGLYLVTSSEVRRLRIRPSAPNP